MINEARLFTLCHSNLYAALVSHEDIVTELAADTLENDAGLGLGGGNFSPGAFSQVACLNLKVIPQIA